MDFFPSDEHTIELLKAVFICVRGDGEISDKERQFFLGYLDAVGAPESLHPLINTYQGTDTLEELLKDAKAINENTKRAIIYTAIIVSGADGYAPVEHDEIVKMAGIMGVSADVVKQIEEVYFEDQKANEKRYKVLFPGTHPWKH